MQGWAGSGVGAGAERPPTLTRINPIYSEAEDAVAGRSKASSSGYGSQRGSGGGSVSIRSPPLPSANTPLRPDSDLPPPVWPFDFNEDPYGIYSTYQKKYFARFGNKLPTDGNGCKIAGDRLSFKNEILFGHDNLLGRRLSYSSSKDQGFNDYYVSSRDSIYSDVDYNNTRRSGVGRRGGRKVSRFLSRERLNHPGGSVRETRNVQLVSDYFLTKRNTNLLEKNDHYMRGDFNKRVHEHGDNEGLTVHHDYQNVKEKQQLTNRSNDGRSYVRRNESIKSGNKEVSFVSKEYDYFKKYGESLADKYLTEEKNHLEKSNKGSYSPSDSSGSSRNKDTSHLIGESNLKGGQIHDVFDGKSLKKDQSVNGSHRSSRIDKPSVDNTVRSPRDPTNFFDSLQDDPFLLYSKFIEQEESITKNSVVKDELKQKIKIEKRESIDRSTENKYEIISDDPINNIKSESGKSSSLQINSVKLDQNRKSLTETGVDYSTIDELRAHIDIESDNEIINSDERNRSDTIGALLESQSSCAEREEYLRLLLEDIAVALEEALTRKYGAQGGIIQEARERVALGLVALRKAGPAELQALSASLSRAPATATVPLTLHHQPARAPSPHSRKPSLWQHYYMRAHSIHSLDSIQPQPGNALRPEAQFTLGAAGEQRLAARLATSRRARRVCHVGATALALLFFLLALVACSLLLTNGRATFGSMM